MCPKRFVTTSSGYVTLEKLLPSLLSTDAAATLAAGGFGNSFYVRALYFSN